MAGRSIDYKVLQEQAYDYIRERIMDGTFQYNIIYSESKTAVDIGISRTPVRDAIHRLFQEGLVDIIPNKGFTLHKMTGQDVMEIYEMRSAIEGFCAFKAAADKDSERVRKLLADMEASYLRMQQISKASGSPLEFAKEDEHFHTLLVESSENERFTESFHAIIYQVRKLAEYALGKEGRMEETLKEHRDILDAISAAHSKGAYAAILNHMSSPLRQNLESVYQAP